MHTMHTHTSSATVLSMSRVYESWNNWSWKRLLEVIPYKIPLKAGPASKSNPTLTLDETDQSLMLPSFEYFQGWTGLGIPALLTPSGLTKTAARSPSATSLQGRTKAAPQLLSGAPRAYRAPHQDSTPHASLPCCNPFLITSPEVLLCYLPSTGGAAFRSQPVSPIFQFEAVCS